MDVRIFYDRITREVWLTDDAGSTVDTAKARPRERMADAAGRLLTDHGLMRTSDYMLVAGGSPMRWARAAKAPRPEPVPTHTPRRVPARFGRGAKIHLASADARGRVITSVPLCGTHTRPGAGVAVSAAVTCQKCLASAAAR